MRLVLFDENKPKKVINIEGRALNFEQRGAGAVLLYRLFIPSCLLTYYSTLPFKLVLITA